MPAYEMLYIESIIDDYKLTRDEKNDIINRVLNGETHLREVLINSSIIMVLEIAKEYIGLGIEYCELVSQGIFGLVKATHKFSSKTNLIYNDYITRWIKAYINMLLRSQDGILLRFDDSYFNSLMMKNKKLLRLRKSRRKPTLSQALRFSHSPSVMSDIMKNVKPIISFDVLVENGFDLIDENVEHPVNAVYEEAVVECIKQGFSLLTPRQLDVVVSHLGLNGVEYQTLEEIGLRYNTSRQRIYQILLDSFDILRNEYFSKVS